MLGTKHEERRGPFRPAAESHGASPREDCQEHGGRDGGGIKAGSERPGDCFLTRYFPVVAGPSGGPGPPSDLDLHSIRPPSQEHRKRAGVPRGIGQRPSSPRSGGPGAEGIEQGGGPRKTARSAKGPGVCRRLPTGRRHPEIHKAALARSVVEEGGESAPGGGGLLGSARVLRSRALREECDQPAPWGPAGGGGETVRARGSYLSVISITWLTK